MMGGFVVKIEAGIGDRTRLVVWMESLSTEIC